MTTESFADQAQAGTAPIQAAAADQPAATQDDGGRLEQLLRKMEKRLEDKDDFIGKLKSERRTDEEELAKRDKEIAELRQRIDALSDTHKKLDAAMDGVTSQRAVSGQDKPVVNLDVDEIVTLATAEMERKLTAEQQARAEKENFAKVEAAVKEAYGDKYIDAVAKRCAELGLPVTELDRIAKASPTAAVELLALKPSGVPKPTTSSFNTSAFKEQPQQQKPKSIMGVSNTKADVDFWRSLKPN